MDHIHPAKDRRRAHAARVVRAHAHQPDAPLGLLFIEIVQRLAMPAQRVDGFLLVQHKDIHIFAI